MSIQTALRGKFAIQTVQGELPSLGTLDISGLTAGAANIVAHNLPIGRTPFLTLLDPDALGLWARTQPTDPTISFVLTAAGATGTSFVLTSVVGSTGVYAGTITGGASNAFAGQYFTVTGFAASSGVNNGTFLCTASTAIALTLVNAGATNETHAGAAALGGNYTGVISGGGVSTSYAIASVVGSTKTYTGVFTGGDNNAFQGQLFTVTGMVASTGANNGTFVCLASTATTLVLANASATNETQVGSATTGGFIGRYFTVSGFTNAGNNGTFLCVGSSPTTLTLVNGGLIAETHAGAVVGGFVYITVGSGGSTSGRAHLIA
jgi:hypothetical protein